MTHCKQGDCKLTPYRLGRCFTHFRLHQGYVFDPEQKLFVKGRRRPTGKYLPTAAGRQTLIRVAPGPPVSPAAGEDQGAWPDGKTLARGRSGFPASSPVSDIPC
jgi:hypothetical protein